MPTYKKISELTDAGTIVGDELIEIVQGGASRKVTVSGFAKSTPVTTVTGADLTMTDRDDAPVVLVATAGADRTVTLPAGTAMEAGDFIEVHKTDSATGATIIASAGSDTIEGASTYSLVSRYNNMTVRWLSSYWGVTQLNASYDTGWVANTNWLATTFTITHNLGSTLDGLIAKVMFSSDGTDANGWESHIETQDRATSATLAYGVALYNTSANVFGMKTGRDGVLTIDPAGVWITLGSSSPYYYRVVVRRFD